MLQETDKAIFHQPENFGSDTELFFLGFLFHRDSRHRYLMQ